MGKGGRIIMADTNIPANLTEEEIMLHLSTIVYSDAFNDPTTKIPYLDGTVSVYEAVQAWTPPIKYEKGLGTFVSKGIDWNGVPIIEFQEGEDVEVVGNAAMYQEEWQQVKDSILAHPEVFENMTIQNITDNDPMDRSVAITDGNGDLIVVYRGTASGEWVDNGKGAYANITDTQQQQLALEYFQEMKELYGQDASNIYVTGHSKGGNKTMYVGVLDDDVTHAYAFDGQGFSTAFLAKYAEEILVNNGKITNISNRYDFVNILMYSIAGNQVFTDSQKAQGVGDIARYHSPITLMEYSDGSLSLLDVEEVEQDPSMELLGRFLCYLCDTMPEEEFQVLIYQLMLTMTGEKVRKELGLPEPDLSFDDVSTLLSYLNEFALTNNVSPKEMVALLELILSALPSWAGNIIRKYAVLFAISTPGSVFLDVYTGNSSNFRVRDFTEETKQKLLDLVDELEEEKEWWKFWTWDVYDRIADLFGQLTPEKYLDDMDSYYKKVIDVNDASKKTIEQIFQNVEEVDINSKTKMNEKQEELSNIISNLKTFNSKLA